MIVIEVVESACRLSNSRHRQVKDCRMCSNKSGALAISAEATTIHTMGSSIVASGVAYTSDFRWFHNTKSKGSQVMGAQRLRNRSTASNPHQRDM
ncbi:hypothetical protein TNCV_2627191 [Trichonephila clavipes]|uniref:Uncharacterized protein n=1 Tax=Trichonephila clavipes TaxID=2585209 RepID=A0A8X6W7Y1_TRICX|nr:hypothetical protein TNCV_2627191 [Trichonephila clavipes]